MKKRILIGISLFFTTFTFAQQIGNSDFEAWGAVSGGTEPTNWNSFLTASGGFSGQAANQLEQVSDVRPGSSGTSSVKVKSRTVNLIVTTIVANGNLTLGKVNMGSASPSDLANHNYTVQGDADFSEALTAKPDSVVFWVKYSAASGTSQAKMKATLHDNYNYKDPEDAASLTHIVATAVSEFLPTAGSWVRKSVPFNYSGPMTDNTFILLTFASNKTPGGGNGNDYIIVDDLELIYNQPLVAVNDSYSGDENTDIICNVLSNDTDPENSINNTTVTIVSQPTNGSVVVSGAGVITYTPNLNYFGADSYVYNVCDNGVQINCDDATVNITVNAVNQPLVANDDAYFTPIDVAVDCDVLANDTDVENEINVSSINVTVQPTNGMVSVNTTTGVITYTPNSGYEGTDEFEYEICDAGNPSPVHCTTATVTITVFNPVTNQQVIAVNDNFTGQHDTDITCDVLANDTDPENEFDLTSLTVTVQPTNGSAIVDNGVIIYTPNSGYSGPDAFEYEICDLGSPTTCANADVTIDVTNLDASLAHLTSAEIEIKVIGNTIHFQGASTQSGTYYVYDLVGQLIQKGKIASQVSFQQKSGVYIISVDSTAGEKTKRVFKN